MNGNLGARLEFLAGIHLQIFDAKNLGAIHRLEEAQTIERPALQRQFHVQFFGGRVVALWAGASAARHGSSAANNAVAAHAERVNLMLVLSMRSHGGREIFSSQW